MANRNRNGGMKMLNFTYYTPTKVVFGRNAEAQTANLVREFGGKKLLIHYGGGSVIRSGLLQRITDSLDEAGISYVTLGGVVPNPRLSLVYQGIDLCKTNHVDFILAVGGGSVIDSAKAIGYGVVSEGDVWDFYDYKRKAEGCLPVGVVLTIAATGSEMSASSVITDDRFPVEVCIGDGRKQVYGHEVIDFLVNCLSFLAQSGGHEGQSLCDIDQKILHVRYFRFLAADAGNRASLASGCFLTLITEHFVFHFVSLFLSLACTGLLKTVQ